MSSRILSLFSFIIFAASHITAQTTDADVVKSNKSVEAFIENKGQVIDQFGNRRDDIDFKLASKGLNVFIGKGILHYQWIKSPKLVSPIENLLGKKNSSDESFGMEPIEMYRMDVKLLGANPNVVPYVEVKIPIFHRYYLPTTGDNGSVAYLYQKVTYKNIYPNIDWVLYFNKNGELEHDFVVREGGKVSDIQIQYDGSTDLNINNDGSLTAVTPFGSISESAPYSYEQHSRKKIPSAYVLGENLLSFSASSYEGTLVIDPSIAWGTYFGGIDNDRIYASALGKDNMFYVAGNTSSIDNIATIGSYQNTFLGNNTSTLGSDAFIAKWDKDGKLIWATYYGGTAADNGRSLAVDTAGSIYLGGCTNSNSGIATPGSYQTVRTGSNSRTDAFLAKFDTSGKRIWGTYFGGNQFEANEWMALTADNAGHIYLTGNTNSTSGIATTGAFQTSLNGAYNAFIAKFNTNGNVDWATYYGGNGGEIPKALTTDQNDNLYIAGTTQASSSGIATFGTHQSIFIPKSGNYAFLAKFSSSGQQIWGTYFGGEGTEDVNSITCDDSLNIYLTGSTNSTTGIATPNSHQSSFGGDINDVYLSKFKPNGRLQWSTYYGGAKLDFGNGIQFGTNGDLYLVGNSNSVNNIATVGGMQPVNNGSTDIFISRFDVEGKLKWGTYLGGSGGDISCAFSLDRNLNLLIGGFSGEPGLATSNAHQINLGGDEDGFLVRIKDCIRPEISKNIVGPISVCEGSSQNFTANADNATSFNWIKEPLTWLGNSIDSNIKITFDNNNGVLKVFAINDCDASDTISIDIQVNPVPDIPIIERNENILSTSQTFGTYQWELNGQPISGAINSTYIITQNGVYTVVVTDGNDCSSRSEALNLELVDINGLIKENSIRIYPNPAVDKVNIQLPESAVVSFYSIDGKCILSQKIGSGNNNLDISGFSKGLYTILLSDINGAFKGAMLISISK